MPEEMFADKTEWEHYIFNSSNCRDIDTDIHEDERTLANLIERGLYDESYRKTLLQQTEEWESHNDKICQFEQYDAISSK